MVHFRKTRHRQCVWKGTAMADKKVAEQYYTPPEKLGKWEGFSKFLWNGETSQCMGRTGSSWGKYRKFPRPDDSRQTLEENRPPKNRPFHQGNIDDFPESGSHLVFCPPPSLSWGCAPSSLPLWTRFSRELLALSPALVLKGANQVKENHFD